MGADEIQCLCPIGQECNGVCSGTPANVMTSSQSCSSKFSFVLYIQKHTH